MECIPFSSLSLHQLYDILELRAEIFVKEQNCIYNDLDRKDQKSIHLLYYVDGDLAAYLRIIPKGISFLSSSIGRVVVKPTYRSMGLARKIVYFAIDYIIKEWKEETIIIGAQCYLSVFYESIGFERISEEYIEDGIPHVDMIYYRNN